MAHAAELRTSQAALSAGAQDVFLDQARRSRAEMLIRLMDGRQLAVRITGFDKFAIVVDGDGGDQLIFKHAIASIAFGQGAGDGASSARP